VDAGHAILGTALAKGGVARTGGSWLKRQVELKKVVLTEGQRARLENLWFIYGNHGPKSTMENHGFIQGFLERDRDERAFYKPTAECLSVVDAVIYPDAGRG
jgi:hypothetical protein